MMPRKSRRRTREKRKRPRKRKRSRNRQNKKQKKRPLKRYPLHPKPSHLPRLPQTLLVSLRRRKKKTMMGLLLKVMGVELSTISGLKPLRYALG